MPGPINLHGGFAYGLAVAGLAAFTETALWIATRRDHAHRRRSLRLWAVLLASGIAGLINPLTVGAYLCALNDITLEVAAGQIVAVSGPSGSGKSTLLHVVGGMDRPDRGSIRVGEQEITSLGDTQRAAYRRQVGFVFQRFHLLPALTSLDNVLAPVMPYRVDFDKAGRARDLLAAVGLAERGNDLPSHLSGGEQQRVAIARALVNRPGSVLADEPTGNLDTANGAMVMDLLLRLRGEYGFTLMIATHDPNLSSRCQRSIHLTDGHLVSGGDVVHHEGI